MRRVGLDEGLTVLEEFPVVGYDLDERTAAPSVGDTALSIRTNGTWTRIPCAQAFKGDGTGPDGVTAEIVDVGSGTREDFRKVLGGVRGKIILFSASDLLFYGVPVLQMAADRGALAAIGHWPVAPDDALRLHTTGPALMVVSISNRDAAKIRSRLALGPVEAKLIVDNHWDGNPRHTGVNVLGAIPGSEFPDEYTYLCAHFDHWFTSAADNNAGVGSLLSIAKAVVDSGLTPKRTLVFASFDAEELGGWSDTWYDWLIGSYSHVLQALDGRVLHPERRGRIVAMINMDVVGTKGAEVAIETTPDVTRFIRRAAEDSGLLTSVPTRIFYPPTSYDDWPFFQAGAPVSQIAWWGPVYERLYHTTADTMESLDLDSIHLNSAFNGLAVLRATQSRVHPYNLEENLVVLNEGVHLLRSRDPTVGERVDTSPLEGAIRDYGTQTNRLRTLSGNDATRVQAVNRAMREAAALLNPRMFYWDFSVPLPGWTGISVFANPANDLQAMKGAIAALRRGDWAKARDLLTGVATMQWGRHMDHEAYRKLLAYVHGVPPAHLLWGEGFLPPLSDVHREYDAIAEKAQTGAADFSSEIASLETKIEDLYGHLNRIARDLTAAVSGAVSVFQGLP